MNEKSMGGNEMSAEELPTPRTDAEAYEVPRDNELRLIDGLTEVVAAGFARQLERELAEKWTDFERLRETASDECELRMQYEKELAQAKAELSALSRASGEAVAWGEIRKMKGGELAIFTASYNVIMAKFTSGGSDGLKDGTKLYLAAPTAPGMCLVPIEQVERAIVWAEACAEFGVQATFPDGLPTPNAELSKSIAADFKAIAAAKGLAAQGEPK